MLLIKKMSASKRARVARDDFTPAGTLGFRDTPCLKVFGWKQFYSHQHMVEPDSKSNVILVEEGVVASSKNVFTQSFRESEKRGYDSDEEDVTPRLTYGCTTGSVGNIDVRAWFESASDPNRATPELFLEPPCVPLPSIAISLRLLITRHTGEKAVADDVCAEMVMLIPVRNLDQFVGSQHTVSIDSREEFRQLALRVLQSPALHSKIKPYLAQMGISATALTPSKLFF